MNELESRKQELVSLEKRFKRDIESGSTIIEKETKRYIQVGAIVGGSLLVGYNIYRLISGKNSDKKQKQKKSGTVNTSMWSPAKKRIAAVAITLLLQAVNKELQKSEKKESSKK